VVCVATVNRSSHDRSRALGATPRRARRRHCPTGTCGPCPVFCLACLTRESRVRRGGGSARALSCDTTLLLNSTSCHPSQNNARGHSRFKRLSEAANDSTLQRPLACGGGPPLVVWDNDSLLWCDTAPCPFLTGAVGGDGASARRLFCVRKWLEHAPPPPS
jgi:hypothetical protein